MISDRIATLFISLQKCFIFYFQLQTLMNIVDKLFSILFQNIQPIFQLEIMVSSVCFALFSISAISIRGILISLLFFMVDYYNLFIKLRLSLLCSQGRIFLLSLNNRKKIHKPFLEHNLKHCKYLQQLDLAWPQSQDMLSWAIHSKVGHKMLCVHLLLDYLKPSPPDNIYLCVLTFPLLESLLFAKDQFRFKLLLSKDQKGRQQDIQATI